MAIEDLFILFLMLIFSIAFFSLLKFGLFLNLLNESIKKTKRFKGAWFGLYYFTDRGLNDAEKEIRGKMMKSLLLFAVSFSSLLILIYAHYVLNI